jgi:hypothetical protein
MRLMSKAVTGCSVVNAKGPVGTVKDLLFDDQSWVVQYIVVEANAQFGQQKVLLLPSVVEKADWRNRRLQVRLDREQVIKAPKFDEAMPVSRRKLLEAKQWAARSSVEAKTTSPVDQSANATSETHLRSLREVRRYFVEATDGAAGRIADVILDDQAGRPSRWRLLNLIIDTGSWLVGRKRCVSPRWATTVCWEDQTVSLHLTRQQIMDAPDVNPQQLSGQRLEEEVVYA